MFETRAGIFLIAGLLFFALAFLSNAVVPVLMYRDLPELDTPDLVNDNILIEFQDLATRYPEPFQAAFGEPTRANCAKALELGRKLYVGEGCWHCHSQFIRPVSRETERWGPVAQTWEYQNVLQRPVLFGTRRVGPDLSREASRRSSDWHSAHFFDPKSTHSWSVMPPYPWLFDGDPNHPNQRGLALITYMQWLGSWLPTYPYFETWNEDWDGLRPATSKQRPPPPREKAPAAARGG